MCNCTLAFAIGRAPEEPLVAWRVKYALLLVPFFTFAAILILEGIHQSKVNKNISNSKKGPGPMGRSPPNKH